MFFAFRRKRYEIKLLKQTSVDRQLFIIIFSSMIIIR